MRVGWREIESENVERKLGSKTVIWKEKDLCRWKSGQRGNKINKEGINHRKEEGDKKKEQIFRQSWQD